MFRGLRDHHVDRVAFDWLISEVHSGVAGHSGVSAQPSRPGSCHGMIYSKEGIRGDLPCVQSSLARPLSHSCEHQAYTVCVTVLDPLVVRPSVRLYLPAICCSQASSLQGSHLDRPLVNPGGFTVAPGVVVRRPSVALGGRTS